MNNSVREQLSGLKEDKPKLTLAQQLAIINKVVGKEVDKSLDIPRYRFTFGKYSDKLFSTVLGFDKDYIIWCYHSGIELPSRVLDYIESELLSEDSEI